MAILSVKSYKLYGRKKAIHIKYWRHDTIFHKSVSHKQLGFIYVDMEIIPGINLIVIMYFCVKIIRKNI